VQQRRQPGRRGGRTQQEQLAERRLQRRREGRRVVLKAINPAIVADGDKAIDNARNQCSTISGGGNAVLTAKARFSTADHEVTDAEAQAINAALKASLCAS
jgi:c-di-GMP-binding flagellar brake protein YcgR